MKRFRMAAVTAVVLVVCQLMQVWAKGSYMAEVTGEKQNEHLAPYFLVDNDSAVDGFPLLKTVTKVNIAGVSSDVELIQVYKNNGEKTLEAIYVFPLGTRSAIHAMKMKIGERVIEAQIEETQKARQIYENAKNNGQTTSLLEQKRPNVFQMNVANIMPGDVVEVITKYTEVLVPKQGLYEFVFPTVVGPRFTGESDPEQLRNKDNWVATPYRTEGKKPDYDFNIHVNLKTGIPLSKIWSTSHKVDVRTNDSDEAIVILSSDEKKGGNRDFILNYSLKGNAIQTGLLLYPGAEENYFLMMLEPPEKVNMKMIPPREYLFIVDVSGSMHGFPLDVSKELIKKIINGLREKDYLNIMFFSGGADILSPHPLQASGQNKTKAINMLNSMRGSGGTAILSALQKALALEKKEGLSRIIITATDGYVSVEKQAFDLIRDNLDQANFFAFGIGSSVNRYIIEGMARAGKGETFIITNKQEAEKTAEKFLNYVQCPLLTDIKVNFEGFEVYDVEPPSVPDLFAERPLVIYGKYKKAAGRINVTGRTMSGRYKKTVDVKKYPEDKDNTALQYLWAREKIARLSDYGRAGQDIKGEVTELGLKYHLMTEYTSFVAVDSMKRATGETVTVKQPLPLPQGVSNLAIGSAGYSMISNKKVKAGFSSPVKLEEKVEREYCIDGIFDAKDKKLPQQMPQQIYVTGGKLPAGMTLYEIENITLSNIKKELEKTFGKWGLTRVSIKINVAQGKIVSVKVIKYTGRKCEAAELEKIFRKIRFGNNVTGAVELDINYI